MKIYDAYKMAIEYGIEHDPRPKEEIDRVLKDAQEQFDKLPEDRKELFDQERLWNPYGDSRLSVGEAEAKEMEAERFMWGIDISTGEVLLADRLREKGQTISAVIAHHPTGTARTSFPEVMWMQADIFYDAGVPINVTEGLVKKRMDEVSRNVLGSNYNQAADAARLTGNILFNIHSPADNLVQEYLESMFDREQPRTLGDALDLLYKEPEMRQAAKYNDQPRIMVGSKDNRCGKIIAKMTGGTSGPVEMYEKLAQAGIGTIVGMHFPESHIEECRKHNINVIISGHMASDSIGINLMCDMWEREGIETIGCSGFTRFSRN